MTKIMSPRDQLTKPKITKLVQPRDWVPQPPDTFSFSPETPTRYPGLRTHMSRFTSITPPPHGKHDLHRRVRARCVEHTPTAKGSDSQLPEARRSVHSTEGARPRKDAGDGVLHKYEWDSLVTMGF